VSSNVVHRIEVLERPSSRPLSGRIECSLGVELRFKRDALERCCSSELEDVDVDFLVVLASIAFADRRARRRQRNHWGRTITLSIPVFERDLWSRCSVQLASLLNHVSGDHWTFEYRPRQEDDHLRQAFLPGLSRLHEGATVMPYSGGLDSYTALARHELEHHDTPLLLVHRPHGNRPLATVLPTREWGVPALVLPFTVSAGRHPEPTYRTRTLIFFGVAALAWRRANARRIWIGENGIGCLGPALVPFGTEHPIRGCHPSFIAALQDFLGRLWGVRPPVELPHLWLTKAEALRDVAAGSRFVDWYSTHTCSRNIGRQHPSIQGVHCGVCSGCLLRRQTFLATGLNADTTAYYTNVFSSPDLPPDAERADREVATYGVAGLNGLALLAPGVTDLRAYTTDLARAVGLQRSVVDHKLSRLLAVHATEWRAFVEKTPKESWIRKFTSFGNGYA
jgi:7-cyano-7-deazaguanine synthase in queuosine biosynthesis